MGQTLYRTNNRWDKHWLGQTMNEKTLHRTNKELEKEYSRKNIDREKLQLGQTPCGTKTKWDNHQVE